MFERYPFLPDVAFVLVGLYFITITNYGKPAESAEAGDNRKTVSSPIDKSPRDTAVKIPTASQSRQEQETILPLATGEEAQAVKLVLRQQEGIIRYEMEGVALKGLEELRIALAQLHGQGKTVVAVRGEGRGVTASEVLEICRFCREQGMDARLGHEVKGR
jgi:pyruvate/2-oxoglutarate dehydrogenase complex dihydrolipoamide acyltransferase (E2) component